MKFIASKNTWIGYRSMDVCFCTVLLCCVYACPAQTMKHDPTSQSATDTSKSMQRVHLPINGVNSSKEQDRQIAIRSDSISPNPSDVQPRPAQVTFVGGKLLIEAHNSSLNDILQSVAEKCRINIDKIENSPQIFGVYGPGESRDVLVKLLYGSNYNFIMVDSVVSGTPRALIVSTRKSSTSVGAPVHPAAETVAASDAQGPSESQGVKNIPNTLGPGAVAPVPSLDKEDDSTRAAANQQRLQHIQAQQQSTPQ